MCVGVLLPLPGSDEPPDEYVECEGPRVRVAVRRDLPEAERRADALRAAGIEASVEIDDTQRALPGASLLPGVLAFPAQLFAYPVTVPLPDRAAARGIIDAFDGQQRRPATPSPLRTVGVAFALGAAVLILRIAIG